MKRILFLAAMSLTLASCGCGADALVVTAPADRDMVEEVVEFEVENPEAYVVYDADKNVVTSQITTDGKLLIQASVEAGESAKFYLQKGEREEYAQVACGNFYPEKLEDVAWENDKIGFRVYAKTYIELGSKLYGYDIFSKRGKEPVLPHLYYLETNEETTRLKKLYKDNQVEYDKLIREISYHLDHGRGMDYYPVGPTLGCGTAALVVDGKTIYPTFYAKHKILENGPLRFKVWLEFDPVMIDGEEVVEERVITLDAGSHFNKIEISYRGLTKPTKVIAGLVLHDEAEVYEINENSVAYADPFHASGWQIYNSLIFDGKEMKGRVDLFDEAGRAAHGGAFGHLQIEGTYKPNSTFTYYMGAGWNGWLVETSKDWFKIVNDEVKRLM
ncbi:MAG: DUF4861 family protein [Rikenellaceae bacterium]